MSLKRSNIWLYFEEVPEKQLAKCIICKSTLSIKGGSLNNLSRHLKSKHPLVNTKSKPAIGHEDLDVPDADDVQVVSVPGSLTHTAPGSLTEDGAVTNTNQQLPSEVTRLVLKKPRMDITGYCVSTKPLSISMTKSIHRQLLRFITSGYHPFSIIEEEEFQTLLRMLNPKYTLPSRKTLSNTFLNEEYEKCDEILKKLLLQAQAVALTTDGWTSINNESFYAVKAHFFDEKFLLRSVLIACEKFDQRHTAENIATFLRHIATEWKIGNKITVVVTDNAYNIVAAVKKCGWRHIGCFAHTLNLIVQALLQHNLLKPSLKKVKGR